jgi:hypothetical protein
MGLNAPPLGEVEISTPFVVRDTNGFVFYGEDKPIRVASFVIEIKGAHYCQFTDRDGRFQFSTPHFVGPFVHGGPPQPGTYRFKVTKDGFHPTVGTVVVSPKAPKQSVMKIELKPDERYLVKYLDEIVPNEHLIAESTNNVGEADGSKYRRSEIDMPISLAVGAVRTPEFSVDREAYYIMIESSKKDASISFTDMTCMMGTSAGPLGLADCVKANREALLLTNWTVWEGEHIVAWGSNSSQDNAKFTTDNVFKFLGMFLGESNKKYVVQVRFMKDGTPLNVTSPHLIVISVANH